MATVLNDVAALTRFSGSSTNPRPPPILAGIDRPLLERYLARLATCRSGTAPKRTPSPACTCCCPRSASTVGTTPCPPRCSSPATPRAAHRGARAGSASTSWPRSKRRPTWTVAHPDARLITRILIRCGVARLTLCTLTFDCLLHDGQGAPYLRYVNHKMRREAAVPIDDELEAEIRVQQDWPRPLARRPPLPARHRGSAAGTRPPTYYSYRSLLNRWLADCDIRDEHGHPPGRPAPVAATPSPAG